MKLPIASLCLTGMAATCIAAAAPPDPARAEAVEVLMLAYHGKVPGASVLVLSEGAVALQANYGFADLETGTAAAADTNYRLASITKQFTAAAVLLLVEDGKLGLDDSVRRWLPSLPGQHDGVTIRHLLSHSSGLIDYEDLMADDFSGQVRDADVLALLKAEPSAYFKPGTSWRYSNSGYALLALVVERVSGQAFPDFLAARIFQPLGMAGTLAYAEGGPAIAHRAYGHRREGDAWVRRDQSSTSAVLGDGGIYSSVVDLARWDEALYDDRLLSHASRQQAFRPAVASDQPEVRYGFGWRITGDSLWHSGETMGFRNVIVRFPERRLTVIVLSNREGPEPYRTALAIADLYRKK